VLDSGDKTAFKALYREVTLVSLEATRLLRMLTRVSDILGAEGHSAKVSIPLTRSSLASEEVHRRLFSQLRAVEGKGTHPVRSGPIHRDPPKFWGSFGGRGTDRRAVISKMRAGCRAAAKPIVWPPTGFHPSAESSLGKLR
jgi:hypothetical protein